MHTLSKKDLNSAEFYTVQVSQSPTTGITADGEVQTNGEATAYVKKNAFIRDSKAPRRYADSSHAILKTARRSLS